MAHTFKDAEKNGGGYGTGKIDSSVPEINERGENGLHGTLRGGKSRIHFQSAARETTENSVQLQNPGMGKMPIESAEEDRIVE